MKKFGLNLDFDAIRERIEEDKKPYKPGVWANMVGVSVNIVSNVHGKTNQNPSLEYIIAVSLATGKPVDYYLFGNTEAVKSPDNVIRVVTEHQDLVTRFKNPQKAKEFNEDLLTLEDIDKHGYDEVHDIVKMKISRKGGLKKTQKTSYTKKKTDKGA